MISAQRSEKLAMVFMAVAWLSILPGQLLRWQPSSAGTAGILVSDLVALCMLPAVIYLLLHKKSLSSDRGIQLLLAWLGIIFLSWLIASPHYSLHAIALALGYVIRLAAYALTFVVAYCVGKKSENTFLRYAIVSVIALFLLGILIIWYLPDFAPLAQLGWDPHVGRFTSTWLDPNYLGSFLALVFSAALCFENKLFAEKRNWMLLMLFLLLCLVSMYLTISRSALVTLAFAAIVAGLRTSWRATAIAIVSLILLVSVPSRLQDRLVASATFVGGTTTSGSVAGGSTASSTDPTASARVLSWKRAWALSKTAPLFGVGYNYYEQAAIKNGLITANGQTRGTSGSDSSLLTLLATTGWLGLLSVCIFFGYLTLQFWKRKGIWASIGLALIAGMVVGAELNNLLLYPLILLPFILALGIAYSHSNNND